MELFFEELTGESPPPAAAAAGPPVTSSTAAAAAGDSPGHTWARELFDEIARRGPPAGMLVYGPADGSRWTIVALSGATTPPGTVRAGDLVVKRALGEGRLVSL